jgi:very-short-patch-repair endonuclease
MPEPRHYSDRNAAVVRARELRRSMTPPERRLWAVLRTRPGDLKFRKQHPLGPFIADFYCASARLVIEVDGDGHDMGTRPALDARRDELLRARGFSVIRFLAVDVMRDI